MWFGQVDKIWTAPCVLGPMTCTWPRRNRPGTVYPHRAYSGDRDDTLLELLPQLDQRMRRESTPNAIRRNTQMHGGPIETTSSKLRRLYQRGSTPPQPCTSRLRRGGKRLHLCRCQKPQVSFGRPGRTMDTRSGPEVLGTRVWIPNRYSSESLSPPLARYGSGVINRPSWEV